MDSGIYDLSFYFSARSLCYLVMKFKNQDELLVSLSLYIMMRKIVAAPSNNQEICGHPQLDQMIMIGPRVEPRPQSVDGTVIPKP